MGILGFLVFVLRSFHTRVIVDTLGSQHRASSSAPKKGLQLKQVSSLKQ